MRKRCVAVSAALVMSVGSLLAAPVSARADSASVLYVNQAASANCSDATTDSAVTPYCTIQAAADVVEPGQTVKIAAGVYSSGVVITRSGTATAPISFEGVPGAPYGPQDDSVSFGSGAAAGTAALVISGASNVVVSDVQVDAAPGGEVSITSSSNIELTRDEVHGRAASDVDVNGGSTGVELDRDYFNGSGAALNAVQIDPGVSGTIITDDIFELPKAAVSVNGAAGTDFTGNTVNASTTGAAVSVIGGATGTVIENDVIQQLTSAGAGILVDSASTAGTSLDYNVVHSASSTDQYSWAGAAYATAAALVAATGQGAHDVNGAVGVKFSEPVSLIEGSPAINSGDANAPGEPSTDFYGVSRALDPNDPITGTGGGDYDRGAVQIRDPLAVSLTASASYGFGPLTETLSTGLTAAGWSPSMSYQYSFGDGTSQTSDSAAITHTYTASGMYTMEVTAVDGDHGSATASTTITVASGNGYFPVARTRLLDTRHGTGAVQAKIPANGTIAVQLAGVGPFPSSGAVAAVLTVTVAAPAAGGYITAYPDGSAIPATSDVNFAAGQTVPELITVKLGADGKVAFHNGSPGPTDLVADLEGYYGPGAGLGFIGVQPYRTETFTATVGTATTGSIEPPVNFGVLPTVSTAAAVNVTVTQGTANGLVTVYPAGGTVPAESNLTYSAGESVANAVIVPITSEGTFGLYVTGKAGATVKVIVDVLGFYTNQLSYAEGFVPVQPTRVIDSRSGLGLSTKGPQDSFEVNPLNLAGLPATATGFTANVTAVGPTGDGYLSSWVFNELTATSTLNFSKGQVVSNMDMYQYGTPEDGSLYFGSSVTTNLVVDLEGYFTG